MRTIVGLIAASLGLLIIAACVINKNYENPPGYELKHPVKFNMPERLTEISGITFKDNKADMIYAEEDEKGRVYYFKPGDSDIPHVTFGENGDYEDIALLDNNFVLLRSDGELFTFPFNELRSNNVKHLNRQKHLLPEGEFEGLYADNVSARLYVLCKHCSTEHPSKTCTVYSFKSNADAGFTTGPTYAVNVKAIAAMSGQADMVFHPSALTKNPATGEWYILSSVNKLLVVADSSWQVKKTYALDPSLFLQPEGITFDDHRNLYISNEGDKITPGNILKFDYHKP